MWTLKFGICNSRFVWSLYLGFWLFTPFPCYSKNMKVVLHICCAVCAAGAAERMIQEGHQVCGFFYNPNIYPEEEYRKRLENTRKVTAELGFSLSEGPYIPEDWNQAIAGMETELEGGQRCPVCFEMRLAKTYQFMLESGYAAFTSTLTMGSNKSGELINRLGTEIAADQFLKKDFKKREGFKRAGELARQWGLYRQHYCGCIYSLKESEIRQKPSVKIQALKFKQLDTKSRP